MWQGKPPRITAQSITRAELPAIQDHYTRRCQEEGPKRCERLEQPQCTTSGTNTTLNSFYNQALRLRNSSSNGYPDYMH